MNKQSDQAATKNALLKRLIERAKEKNSGHQGVPRRGDSTEAPLSFPQQRLWFLEQLEGGLTAYNMPFEWRIRGRLDAEALRCALEALVHRHEAIRTRIKMAGDEPVQVVAEPMRFELPVVDLASKPSEEQEDEVSRLAGIEAERPFDLGNDLMLRGCIVRLSVDDHIFLLTTHHISSDGWSIGLLVKEVGLLYKNYSRGEEVNLMPLELQYADFAAWQSRNLTGEKLSGLLDYWRNQLDGLGTLDLPTDRPRPPALSYRGARHEFEVPGELMIRLRALGKENGATLQMTLLAAYQLLLSRYSRQHDVAVGTPISGRNHIETEGLIGFFVNTLVLRLDLSGEPSFTELLRRVRDMSLDAFDHQDLPFEKLVEELGIERHLDRNPITQVSFQLRAYSDAALALEGLEVSGPSSSRERIRFDLEMDLTQQKGGLTGLICYSKDLFDASTIERMTGHFLQLLTSIVTDPEKKVDELNMLTGKERHQLLVEWNDTAADYPEKCVHEMFEEQVERSPNAIAVVFEGRKLTYRELNERANQLAIHLRELGVVPDTLVGLCVERSLDLVVGVIGILKAGAAYLPLDADQPRSRWDHIVGDSRIRLLVTCRSLLAKLALGGCRAICVDSVTNGHLQSNRCNPSVRIVPENLAYTMYTSGSTGLPKGVQVEHSAVINFLTSMAVEPGLTKMDRLLSVTTITFDISVLELLLPLSLGASVEIVGSELSRDGNGLIKRLTESQATVMQATPSTWRMLIDAGWDGKPDLKILCGGEALSNVLAGDLLGRCGNLWNLYGPTETTVWSTALPVVESRIDGSIGRPIANTQAFVLDSSKNPVPIGIRGELFIGGAGLARGYLNMEGLTAAKFVSNPFSADPDSRLYLSGDSCRWRADGSLQFIERLDDQVKLRGFRIELGEIEFALTQNSLISMCVASVVEDDQGEMRIVAYCMPMGGELPETKQLREDLEIRLPEYMIPSAFVILESLPLTASGKVDKGALPKPEVPCPDLSLDFVAPSTPVEEVLAGIWCDLLGAERVGVNDNFFVLGGHSLLAIRLVARIREVVGLHVTVRTVFERPTVESLSIAMLDQELMK